MYSNSNNSILLIIVIMWTVLISSSFLTKSSTAIIMAAAGSRSNSIIRSCSSSSSGGCRHSSSSSSSSKMIAAFVTKTQPQSKTNTRQHQQQQQQQQQRRHQQQQPQQQPLQQIYQRLSTTSTRLYSSSNNIIDHVKHYNMDDDENKIIIKSQSQQRQRILKQFDTTKNDKKSTDIEMERIEFEKQITIDTLDWLENVVIQYNLCPFAEQSLLKDQLNIDVVLGSNQTEILAAVLGEALRLKDIPGTTLIVCPNLFPNNFIAYLEILNILTEGILPDNDLDGIIQIASFHPEFVFGDSSDTDDTNIENYTNRSPYPLFHLLREADVSYAVDSLDGDDSKVWKRNIAFLNTLEQTIFNTNKNDNDNDDIINNSDDNDNDNDIIDKQQLLRSVFLKGKVSDYYSKDNNGNSNNNNNNKCPLSKIKQYEERIQETLTEFRTLR